MLVPVILAGGSGSRLWPMSREHYPKQLLPLHSSNTLLQDTLKRLEGIDQEAEAELLSLQPALVIGNEEHRFLVAEQLRRMGSSGHRIVLEPVGRNTAPALTLAALAASEYGEDPLLLVLPADHVMTEPEGLHRAVREAALAVQAGAIATFGIVPQRPETGYGYIHRGEKLGPNNPGDNLHAVDRFVEKPDEKTAEGYLASGNFLWNSGMFMVRAGTWLELIENFQPDIFSTCRDAFGGRRDDGDFLRMDADLFAACPSDSIDYAVMEPLTTSDPHRAVVAPLDAGWSDVGAWDAFWEISTGDEQGNVVQGDVFSHDTHDSLLISEHRLLATVGLKDVVVIETPDAVLVADKNASQEVRQVVQWLKTQQRDEHVTHRRVYRPWGSYECLDLGERFQVKRLRLNPGAAISLQKHHHRAEHWVVVAGTARVTRDDEEFLLRENESTYIPLGSVHRLKNPGKVELEVIEVQSGNYLEEDDIVRLEDIYDRMTES